MARPWQVTVWSTLAGIGFVLALAFAIGAALGVAWPALALAALLALGWQFVQLARLLRDSASPRWWPSPERDGMWAELRLRLHRRDREQHRRRRRLLQVLAAFRRAASALPDATVVLAAEDRRILWFNPAASRLLGLHYPRDLDVRIGNLLRAPRVLAWLQGEPGAETLLDVPSPEDESLRLSLRMIDYGERQSLLVARDVSKLMHLEQVRRDFVANVSHELRTPLTVVHGYLEMLDPDEHAEWAPMIAEMRRQSQRMTQIVEDLLTLSRLESRESLDEEPVPMAIMLATLRREGEALSQGRHRIASEDHAGVDLCGAPGDLHSAFSNLVGNAVRYTPEGGRIVVRWRREGDGALVLEVEDSGYGIPAQHIPRLTERFYRVSSSRSRGSGGTGLGLSIVKHVLHLHDAHLEIDSEAGRGSVFRCRFDRSRMLPRDESDAPS